MRIRSLLYSTAAIAAVALLPSQASAQLGASASCGGPLTYTPTLGLGGSLSGCFTYTIQELGEDAYYTSNQAIWSGTAVNFNAGTLSGAQNANSVTGQMIFNDDCGTGGGAGAYAFCSPGGPGIGGPALGGYDPGGELVFGLFVPDVNFLPGYWVYTGGEARNATPAPAGYQAVLLQVTDQTNTFLLAWEDLNTGCQGPLVPSGADQTITTAQLSNGTFLETNIAGDCSGNIVGGGDSDSDFNDSMILIHVTGTPLAVTPEPMTMSLMAMGLVGLGGASLRRRTKK